MRPLSGTRPTRRVLLSRASRYELWAPARARHVFTVAAAGRPAMAPARVRVDSGAALCAARCARFFGRSRAVRALLFMLLYSLHMRAARLAKVNGVKVAEASYAAIKTAMCNAGSTASVC